MISIKDSIKNYTEAFKQISDTPHLDAEILVSQATQLSRAGLFAHSEQALTDLQEIILKKAAERRLRGEPIAYIMGEKEFWELSLIVTPDVLIPRPETECLVEWILEHYTNDLTLKIADLGVGSGAIALALAKERPNWTIHATDYSNEALDIARQNATRHHIYNVYFFIGEWCQALPDNSYDMIASNPPYIASQDKHLQSLTFEPLKALDGGKDGLDDIKIIIDQAKLYLKKEGLLIFEHGYHHHNAVLTLLDEAGYHHIKDHKDLAGHSRFVTAFTE